MSQRFNEYVDEYQNVHIQDKVLGQGGQGVVFRTKDPDLAIKLVTDESGTPVTDEESVERYSKRFKRVRLLPLPENLNISVPAALLQNNAGYVMQLLSEMVPFSHFWLDGKSAENIGPDDIPAWLSAMPENEAKKIVHYYRTGGLRRRLHALYKCASLLARLHGNGMVYGDISPNNIFISEGLDDSAVWLIDADNIRFEITAGGSVVYTPKYGAPELVQGKDGGRPSSDCHAFAVVAFYLLSLIHPFVGKKVDGTDEGDWADEENDGEDVEDKAYTGLFPWVDDQDDDSNSSDSGLPRSLLLTEKLSSLFEGTFGPGRTSPLLRPTIYHWPEALAQAADMTVTCPGCSMNYYYDFIHPETEDHNCPYCKTQRPQVLILDSYRWNGPDKPINSPCWRYVREIPQGTEITIPRRIFDEFAMLDSDTAEVLISSSNNDILIKKSDHGKADLSVAADSHPQSGFQKLYSPMKIGRVTPDVQFWMFAHLNSPRLVKCMISGGGK
ncbi:TPA: lipopolysaccharide kinase [Vibrio cholerae]|uniref:protein kinase domain-containing protein n=1 Tax=Vibrio cholerae TaxID=666 RepID=UPI00129B2225|nr:lipopolysaccharide kinase [Vibrio cholerae]MCD9212420.1 lipopolysaccharide kinase [Vibrio cholerae]MDV2322632.1 lipopolysaccharide kinase [Vibrio cholerae]MRI13508.1 lipopolysaccharide kinase [Vibrio cholerae]HAS3594212.1 lipopolysaccharide kinase [Vibrio cholerae]HAS3638225.1 lipopolysaccharide kinase [Vibrio cholerae]